MRDLVEYVQHDMAKLDEVSWRQMAGGAALAGALLTGTPNVAAAQPAQSYTQVDHFSDRQFACRHCGKLVKIDPELKTKLEQLRQLVGDRKIYIVSGYRCPEHNKAVGGAKNSQHLYGKAADIKIEGMTPREVYQKAEEVGFSYIEPTEKTPSWTHVDVGPVRGQHKQATIGQKLNNPINLMGVDNWKGMIGKDRFGHAIFATLEDGIRAALRNLQVHQQKNPDQTLRQYMRTFKVKSGDYQAEYIAQTLKISPDIKIKDIDMRQVLIPLAKIETQMNLKPNQII
jgi:Peptidase M15